MWKEQALTIPYLLRFVAAYISITLALALLFNILMDLHLPRLLSDVVFWSFGPAGSAGIGLRYYLNPSWQYKGVKALQSAFQLYLIASVFFLPFFFIFRNLQHIARWIFLIFAIAAWILGSFATGMLAFLGH